MNVNTRGLQFRRELGKGEAKKHALSLRIEDPTKRTIRLRVSDDSKPDVFKTIITVESLHAWSRGWLQHRTVSQQHNKDMHGLKGKPQVGLGLRVEFNPQCEIVVRVDDAETWSQVQDGTITGGSLEFYPIKSRTREDGVEIFLECLDTPEMCSVTLTDKPAVAGALILERMVQPNWAFAVVDPKVINGDISDPEQIAALRWFPHHDLLTHEPDDESLNQAFNDLKARNFTVPEFATYDEEKIITLATSHLERHTRGALAMRSRKGTEGMNKWIQMRVKKLVNQGYTEAEAKTQAEFDYSRLKPETRSELETNGETQTATAAPEGDDAANITSTGSESETPQTSATAAPDSGGARSVSTTPQEQSQAVQTRSAGQGLTDAQVQARIDAAVAKVLETRSEVSHSALAGFGNVRAVEKMKDEELLQTIFMRTVAPSIARVQSTPLDAETSRWLTGDGIQETVNIMKAHGLKERALTIAANGTVIFTDMARLFTAVPVEDAVARNHFPKLPMSEVKKRTFPRIDGSSVTVQWDRGATTEITESDPTTDTFDIEVAEMNAKVNVPDEFSLFNAESARFVGSTLIPLLRAQAMYKEDQAFFTSTGLAPFSTKFKGLTQATGVTDIAPSTNGDAFEEKLLSDMRRGLPVKYRNQLRNLVFYLSANRAEDFIQAREARATNAGDNALLSQYALPGPLPFGFKGLIGVYAIPALPENETQGTATNASTAFLMPRNSVAIGDAVVMRIEPIRVENFQTKIQLQHWTGFGYSHPLSIVRRKGLTPAVFA